MKVLLTENTLIKHVHRLSGTVLELDEAMANNLIKSSIAVQIEEEPKKELKKAPVEVKKPVAAKAGKAKKKGVR